MTAASPTARSESSWEQRLLQNAASPAAFKPEYQELKFTLHRKLLERINLEALSGIDDDRIRAEVRQAVLAMVEEEPNLLTAAEKQRISHEVLHEVFGLGPLEPLLQDPSISDILVNGHHQVYVERKGLLELTNVRFHDEGHLLRIIDKIVSQVGRRVDESNPMVDARLSDGSRVNAIIPPLAVDGALLSIRRFGTDKLMPDDLVAKGALTRGMMRLLEAAVKAKLNIIVSGGTGAGKTTLLNALSWFISPKERILTIEDAAELQLKQPHVVRLETRPANLEGHGAVRQRQLLINSLRMRPDRIIVGEVRGEEALDMLQAMNTGHDGSLTTVHANTPRDAIVAPRSDGDAGQCQHAPDGDPPADHLGGTHPGAVLALERRHAPRDQHHGGDRHGRGYRDPAGHLRLREARPDAGWQGAGPLLRHRHPARSSTRSCWPPGSGCRSEIFDEMVEVGEL